MSNDTSTPAPDPRQSDSPTWWETRAGLLTSLGLLALTFGMLILAGLSDAGVWEPWESRQLLVASEYSTRSEWDSSVIEADPEAPGYNWAVPTLGQQPEPASLLSTWLVSSSLPAPDANARAVVGALERNARLPTALLLLLCVALGYATIRQRFGTLAATLSGVAFLSLPAIYLGAHNLATPTLSVATTALAILGFWQLHDQPRGSKKAWLWAAVFGAGLILTFIDLRLTGLAYVLCTLTSVGLVQAATGDDAHKPPRAQLGVGVLVIVLPIAYRLLLWPAGELLPHEDQLWTVTLIASFLIGSLIIARRSPTGRALTSIPGLLALTATAIVSFVVLNAYADVNPTLLKNGIVHGPIPALTYGLGSMIPSDSLAQKQLHFDLWSRQIGFGAFPWIALAPMTLAYLGRSREGSNDASTDQRGFEHLLLVWLFVCAFILSLTSSYGHYFFVAYFPLAAGIGITLADTKFWDKVASNRPFLLQLAGFFAVAIIMMLGKDLERYPHRFIELYAQLPNKLELPEGFAWGSTYKPMKYIMAAASAASFFAAASFAWLGLRDLRALPGHLKKWRAKETPLVPPLPDERSSMQLRLDAREDLYKEGGIGQVIAKLESAQTRALLLAAVFALFGALTLFSYWPRAAREFSPRHIMDTYLEHSTDEQQLYSYLLANRDDSLYLRDLEALPNKSAYLDAFGEEDALFAIVPRKRLAQVNFDTRTRYKQNAHVLDARSKQYVLISNKLPAGVEDQNFISNYIVDAPADSSALPAQIQHPVEFTDANKKTTRARFDDKLELLGYSLDKKGSQRGDDAPLYRPGGEIELTLYFKVISRVPSSQKVFVHIDTSGNRVHGDHYPANGEFPTNYWMPGDIIKDTHTIKIDDYAKFGTYSINFGFYIGKKRMKITPASAHKGDRTSIGELRIGR